MCGAWVTTLALILSDFSRSGYRDQRLTAPGNANRLRKLTRLYAEAGQVRPVQSVLTLLDPMLRRPTLVVEPSDVLFQPTQVGHDEADFWKRPALAPLDLNLSPSYTFL